MPKIDSYSLDTSITDTDSLLGVNAADGKTKRYTMSAIKTALLAGADITAVTAGTGLSGGGTSGAVELTIDGTVATLAGSQTLTNKTLTAPIISSISNSGTLTLPTSSDTLVGRATTDTLTNKTLTSPSIATPTWTATESAIANGDYLLFLDASASSETKKEGLDDIASLFAGTGLSASSSVLSVDAAQTGITSLLATDIKIGEDDQTKIDFETADTINFYAGNEKQLILTDGALTPGSNAIVDLGTDALEFKDAYFDGTVEADAITVGGTNIVTGGVITTLGTVSSGTWNGTAIDTAYIDTTLTSQTSILNSSLVVGRDAHNQIDFSTDNQIKFKTNNETPVIIMKASGEIEATSLDISGAADIGGNLTISGDLTVSGDTTTVNTATLSVEDPLIIVGSGNNSSDSVDLGLYGLYDTSGSQDLYSGLFRDASDSGKWKLFKSLQTAPTTTVNTSGTGYAVDTLVANIEGNVTGNVTGNTSGTAATVTTAAQTNITSLGTLTGLDVNGAVTINDNLSLDGSNKELRFYEGSNYVGFEAPALSADQIWVLPTADGTSGTALKTDGSGNLSWGTAGGNVFKTISVSGQSDIVADGVEDTLTIVAGTGTTITTNAGTDTITIAAGTGTTITTNAGTDTITINAGANTVEVDEYTGNGSTAQYTLSTACTNENNLMVYMDGVYQHHNTYSVSSTTLTFDTNVPNGAKVEAYHMISVSNSNLVQSAVAGALIDVSSGTGDVTFNVDLTEAGEAAIANGDYILFLDGGATGTHAKEAIADVATLFAGAGLTASSSVMAVGAGTGITVNANDVAITAAQTGITSVVNSSLEIGRDADNRIKFGTDNQIIFEVDGGDNVIFKTSGEIEASSLDISGDADIDGTLEADAITVDGTALNEYIADTVGAMVGSNTETGIAVTYEDGDNTLDFVLGAAQTTITSLLATDIKIGEDDQTKIDFETADTINFYAGNEKQLVLTDGALTPGSNAIVDLGTDALEFKDGYFDGTLEADAITIGGTNVVTGSLITTLGTISAGVWNGTAIAQAYIANDAINGDKIADDAVNSEHYTDGSIDTAHIADNNITHDKLENRYTVLSALGTGGSQTLDFSAATTFTATMNGNATFTITNPKQGQVVDLILAGNHTPTLAMSGATFNKVGGVDYDGSATNLIQIVVADDSASEIFYYSVATIASDTTP